MFFETNKNVCHANKFVSLEVKPKKKESLTKLKVWIVKSGHFVTLKFCPVLQCKTWHSLRLIIILSSTYLILFRFYKRCYELPEILNSEDFFSLFFSEVATIRKKNKDISYLVRVNNGFSLWFCLLVFVNILLGCGMSVIKRNTHHSSEEY